MAQALLTETMLILENLEFITLVPFGLQISTTHHFFMHLIINFFKITSMGELNQISKENKSS
jgi:hypothetical protein